MCWGKDEGVCDVSSWQIRNVSETADTSGGMFSHRVNEKNTVSVCNVMDEHLHEDPFSRRCLKTRA